MYLRTTVLVLTFLLVGCAPVYIPNVVNTPLLSNKGEIQAAINTGSSGFDPQIAFAITDNIGVMVNGSFRNSTSDTSNNYHKHNFGEIGLGYYKKINLNSRFGIYSGLGYGEVNVVDESAIFASYSNIYSYRFFIQPEYGTSGKIVDFGIASRFVFLNIHQASISYTKYYVEPAITARFGLEHFKFSMQFGYSIPLNNNYTVDYNPFMFSFGLHANINRIFQ